MSRFLKPDLPVSPEALSHYEREIEQPRLTRATGQLELIASGTPHALSAPIVLPDIGQWRAVKPTPVCHIWQSVGDGPPTVCGVGLGGPDAGGSGWSAPDAQV